MKKTGIIFMKTIIWMVTFVTAESLITNCLLFGQEAQSKNSGTSQIGIRDPFLSLLAKKAENIKKAVTIAAPKIEEVKPPELSVQGLVWGKVQPQAIVNNKVVTIGDTIEEAKIVEINKNGISILYKGKIFSMKPSVGEDGQKK